MKKFFISLIFLSLNLTCFASELSLGQKWVKEFVQAYNDGKFEARLATLDAEVQKGLENGTFTQYLNSKQNEIADDTTDETDYSEYMEKAAQLQKEHKEALTKVANAYPDTEIAKSIQVFVDIETFQCPALQKIEAILKKEQFHEISLQSELRRYAAMTLVDFEMIEGARVGYPTEAAANQFEIDSFLICYEQHLKAFKIAQAQGDPELIQLFTQGIDERISMFAVSHDMRCLNLIGDRKMAPQNEAEKQVAEVMPVYQAKQKALVQEYFPMPE